MKPVLYALFMMIISFPAFAEEAPPSYNLKRVKAEYVCMVNDTAFEKPQIPVEVAGKTYYGCCMMCKERLQKDVSIRKAIDPVSGVEVDKTEAIIGATSKNKVYYFENEDNLHAYDTELSSKPSVE